MKLTPFLALLTTTLCSAPATILFSQQSPWETGRFHWRVSNVVNQDESWATSYSHGEFLRAGYDQRLEIDPRGARLPFQGASDQEYQKGGYGDITWRLGLLDLVQLP